jgi:hypothetical protein
MNRGIFARGVAGLVPAAMAFVLAACSSPTSPGLEGGMLATFDVQGERYSIFITNAKTIEQVLALSNGQSAARIPSGRLVKGREAYNAPWSWHIDPEDVEMAEVTMELCDGRPSDVEKDIDYWVGTVGRFCPWSAVLVALKDYR